MQRKVGEKPSDEMKREREEKRQNERRCSARQERFTGSVVGREK